jgi:ketol-acid reductoisomerase
MTRILRDADADVTSLQGATVGVFGFGNQGSAQALCLRDAGLDVRVFVRPGGPSGARARAEQFEPSPLEALEACDVVAVLVPDEAQRDVLEGSIGPRVKRGALLVLAHGFAVREEPLAIREDLDVALVGPLGPGTLLRERFLEGRGLPGLFAIVRNATGSAETRALGYAAALGMTRAGLLTTNLEEEVVSDLFAEQVVLVGGVVELIRAAWETLVSGGVAEEIAYYSCVQELKQIMDIVAREGPAGMRGRISGTAKYGGLTRGPRLVGAAAREEMRRILDEIRDGRFAAEWMEERAAGSSRLTGLLRDEAAHPMEEVGHRVREELGGGVAAPRGGVEGGGG